MFSRPLIRIMIFYFTSDMLTDKKCKKWIAALVAMLVLAMPGHVVADRIGRVIDSSTGKPLKWASVTLNGEVALTDDHGRYAFKTSGDKLSARAHGYARADQIASDSDGAFREIKLAPFTPKALYLSFFGIGDKTLRESALKLIEETELNAVVIDVKGDRGMIPYKSSVPLASEVGAQRIITVKDMSGLMRSLKETGIYAIARIVVFKDDLLAQARPDLAVKTPGGQIWHDRENLAWVDPFKKEVWDYNIDIAIEAAQYGFDEIQFDYVRFPDAVGLRFSMPNTEETRVKAITQFLMEARKRLSPYNVFIAADIFGYVCWNLNDTDIGQKLEDLAPVVDYLSPMLYPSGFQHGIPGYRLSVAHPYEIVLLSLKRAQVRTGLPPNRFRPWLQAFRDYAFDGRHFTGREVREQIKASEEFGSNGWMLWNPSNVYSPSANGLKRKRPSA